MQFVQPGCACGFREEELGVVHPAVTRFAIPRQLDEIVFGSFVRSGDTRNGLLTRIVLDKQGGGGGRVYGLRFKV